MQTITRDITKNKKFKKIYIEITNSCNLRCSFCSKTKRSIKFMTKDEFEHILKEIHNKTNYIYLHIKGEPLLHPQIIDFLKLAEKYDLKVNLTTNGTIFPKLVSKLKKCSALHKINFSLHSENNIPNYLESIFTNVEKLPTETIIIYRIWTLKNGNLDKKSTEIVEKLIEYYNLSTDKVEKIKTEKNIKISSTIYVDKDNQFIWPNIDDNKNCNGFCQALKKQIGILSDGTVVPCCLDGEGNINLGNIYKESFEDILNKEKTKKLQKSFQDRKPKEKLCLNCTYKNRFKM